MGHPKKRRGETDHTQKSRRTSQRARSSALQKTKADSLPAAGRLVAPMKDASGLARHGGQARNHTKTGDPMPSCQWGVLKSEKNSRSLTPRKIARVRNDSKVGGGISLRHKATDSGSLTPLATLLIYVYLRLPHVAVTRWDSRWQSQLIRR